ncbi:hypothetical protein C8250_042600 [Streptomyces sp. So13.3]|uniref:hypothetical protein n=1 Tax=Streptomyces TaxID=1883 RepID=UPI0011059DA5|nr:MULTISPECIES: hypothetical protein [Streptomyces]MCZ4102305.1 hypothetical protein [Streptomyces sp. H39-C1]QNA77576.1 hypothetical protein C8250_042600 [Streptomyces sp. So13.3]
MDLLSAVGGGTGIMVLAAISSYRKTRKARRPAQPADSNRSIDPAAYGMVPIGRVDTTRAAAGSEGEAVAAAALGGDWRTASAYLHSAGTNWDLRWHRLGYLAEAAAQDDSWVRAWQAEQPYDPGAALVHADGLISLAGNLRGSQNARHTSHEQFEAFHRVLAQARHACDRAVELAPADPTPYVAQLSVARGLGWSHEEFRALWTEIVTRDPYHFGAHTSALQYWCAKWQGSHELMHGFAQRAAASAPHGDLLATLPIFAFFEQKYRDGNEDIYALPTTAPAVDAALRAVANASPGHYRLPAIRHMLAYTLESSGRNAEAVVQFQLIGGFAGGAPWSYFGEPLKVFAATRARAVVGWEDAGRPAVAAL